MTRILVDNVLAASRGEAPPTLVPESCALRHG